MYQLKTTSRIFIFIISFLFYFWSSVIFAEPAVPFYDSPVVDQTGILQREEKEELRAMLRDFEKENGAEIAVLIIPRLQQANLEKYSLQVARTWELGSLRSNTGVLFLIVLEDRKMRIEVGTDLENKLSNSRCRRILDQYIAPHFKRNNHYQGIDAGLNAIMDSITSPGSVETSARDGQLKPSVKTDYKIYLSFIPVSILFLFFGYFILRIATKDTGGPYRRGTGKKMDAILLSSYSSSAGHSGGDSSGEGSFGGGGASGSW